MSCIYVACELCARCICAFVQQGEDGHPLGDSSALTEDKTHSPGPMIIRKPQRRLLGALFASAVFVSVAVMRFEGQVHPETVSTPSGHPETVHANLTSLGLLTLHFSF